MDGSVSFEKQVPLANSLPSQIAEYLAERIFSGVYSAGERLKEEELAALFHTSRAPVREALYLLQLDGLVERLPRRGTVVRAYSDEDIQDLYEARSTLELSTIERIRTRFTPDMPKAFDRILGSMQDAIAKGDSEAYSRCNGEFHETLFQFAGSRILHRLYQQLGHPLKYMLQFSTQSVAQMQASYEEHSELVECLRTREFEKAKEILSENVSHGMTRVINLRHTKRPQD